METNNKWIITDPSTNQMGRTIEFGVYEFKEDRIINPITKETEEFKSIIDLSDYTEEQKLDAISTFGYQSMNAFVLEYEINTEFVLAECLFEFK